MPASTVSPTSKPTGTGLVVASSGVPGSNVTRAGAESGEDGTTSSEKGGIGSGAVAGIVIALLVAFGVGWLVWMKMVSTVCLGSERDGGTHPHIDDRKRNPSIGNKTPFGLDSSASKKKTIRLTKSIMIGRKTMRWPSEASSPAQATRRVNPGRKTMERVRSTFLPSLPSLSRVNTLGPVILLWSPLPRCRMVEV